jgi:hypothetical protein
VASLLALGSALSASGGAVSLPWIIVALAAAGLGNMLMLPALIGVALSGIRPEQAGIASGTLNTTQQFAGSAGIAALGAVFFATLGPHSGRAAYAHATATALWIDLGLALVIAALAVVLAPRRADAPAGHHPASPAASTTAASGVLD